jgi:hypothetical protein
MSLPSSSNGRRPEKISDLSYYVPPKDSKGGPDDPQYVLDTVYNRRLISAHLRLIIILGWREL